MSTIKHTRTDEDINGRPVLWYIATDNTAHVHTHAIVKPEAPGGTYWHYSREHEGPGVRGYARIAVSGTAPDLPAAERILRTEHAAALATEVRWAEYGDANPQHDTTDNDDEENDR